MGAPGRVWWLALRVSIWNYNINSLKMLSPATSYQDYITGKEFTLPVLKSTKLDKIYETLVFMHWIRVFWEDGYKRSKPHIHPMLLPGGNFPNAHRKTPLSSEWWSSQRGGSTEQSLGQGQQVDFRGVQPKEEQSS